MPSIPFALILFPPPLGVTTEIAPHDLASRTTCGPISNLDGKTKRSQRL